MNDKGSNRFIDLAGISIGYTLKRSDRSTLGITVFPDGKVLASAPLSADFEAVEQRLRKRGGWILSKIREFERFQPRTAERTFEPGETHRFLGRQYRLKVAQGLKKRVHLSRDHLIVEYPQVRSPEATRDALQAWLHAQAKTVLCDRLVACKAYFSGERPLPKLTVRRLTKRWGSMSADGKRMLLNTRLVEAPINCIDYVIVHELCHVVEPNHGVAFYEMMEKKLPDWERRKQQLENFMI